MQKLHLNYCYNLLGRVAAAGGRLVGEASPEVLGTIRVLVFGLLLIDAARMDLSEIASLPRSLCVPNGLMRWLVTHRITPHVERFPDGGWGVRGDGASRQRRMHHGRSLREALAYLALAVATGMNGQNA